MWRGITSDAHVNVAASQPAEHPPNDPQQVLLDASAFLVLSSSWGSKGTHGNPVTLQRLQLVSQSPNKGTSVVTDCLPATEGTTQVACRSAMAQQMLQRMPDAICLTLVRPATAALVQMALSHDMALLKGCYAVLTDVRESNHCLLWICAWCTGTALGSEGYISDSAAVHATCASSSQQVTFCCSGTSSPLALARHHCLWVRIFAMAQERAPSPCMPCSHARDGVVQTAIA